MESIKLKFIKFFKLTDVKIFKKLSKEVFLRNGVGYGFISDDYLYDNQLLEVGFGRTTSGRGDWGGGFDYASTSPLKITIDRDYIIHKIETDSFYNNKNSKVVEKKAIKLKKRLNVSEKFHITDKELKTSIDKIFHVLPCKCNIGWDVFKSPHMVKFFTDTEKRWNSSLRDINPKKLKNI